MDARELKIPGAWEFTPRIFPDNRGLFLEWFKDDVFRATVGQSLTLTQANHSISAKGVVRGVHFAQVPPSQGKYVYCVAGAVLDVVIDIRVGSPTFGAWDSVLLDSVDRRAVYVSEGLGHAFLSLQDDSCVTYLCSTGYNPTGEFGTNPLDPALALPWPDDIELRVSDKDREAPSLEQAQAAGILPNYEECLRFYAGLRDEAATK